MLPVYSMMVLTSVWCSARGLSIVGDGNRAGGGTEPNMNLTDRGHKPKADSRIVNLGDKSLGLSAYSNFSPSPFLGTLPKGPAATTQVGYGEAIPVPLPPRTRQPDSATSDTNQPGAVELFQTHQLRPSVDASYYTQGGAMPASVDASYYTQGGAVPASALYHRPHHDDQHQQDIALQYHQGPDSAFVFPELSGHDSGVGSPSNQESPGYTLELHHYQQPTGLEEPSTAIKQQLLHHQQVYDLKPNKFEHDYSVTDFNTAPGFDYSTTSLEAQTTTSHKPSLETVELNKHMAEHDRKLAWKDVLKVLAAVVPLGLFVAALHPNVVVVNATDSVYTQPSPQKFKSLAALKSIEPMNLSETCVRRRLCDVLALALKAEALNGTYEAIKKRSPQVGKGLLKEVVGVAKGDRCQQYPCHRPTSWTFT